MGYSVGIGSPGVTPSPTGHSKPTRTGLGSKGTRAVHFAQETAAGGAPCPGPLRAPVEDHFAGLCGGGGAGDGAGDADVDGPVENHGLVGERVPPSAIVHLPQLEFWADVHPPFNVIATHTCLIAFGGTLLVELTKIKNNKIKFEKNTVSLILKSSPISYRKKMKIILFKPHS